jgi:hypothetical protein
MDKQFVLFNSNNPKKKYMIKYVNPTTGNINTIHFGAAGMDDYTITKDLNQKNRYIKRHQSREDWTINGIYTAGFFSRFLLWNLPNLDDSIENTENKFKIKIYNKID